MQRAAGEKGRSMGMQKGMGREGVMARPVGLGSARDRARLREREAAERARVERVLARGPREAERRREERIDSPQGAQAIAAAPARTEGAPPIPTRIDAATMRATACGLCGGRDVVEDEVGGGRGGGPILLGRCRRCDHRWTDLWTERSSERFTARFVPRVRRPLPRSVAVRQAGARGGASARSAPGAPIGA